MARESINRNSTKTLCPENGYWTVELINGNYFPNAELHVPLSLREKLQKVGVFVDYEGGRVSFYNVETRAHIYSFIGCTFAEKLYPYFNTCDNELGPNLAPFVICPVNHTD